MMARWFLLCFFCWWVTSGAAYAAAKPEILFSNADAKVVVRTVFDKTEDSNYQVVELVERGRTVFGSRNGYPVDSVKVLWTRPKGRKDGPTLIVAAYTGGSHCYLDIMSFDLDDGLDVQSFSMCNHEEIDVHTDQKGLPTFDIFFDIEAFNSPASGIVGREIPMHWVNRRFSIDLQRLLSAAPPDDVLRNDEKIIREEIEAWQISSFPPDDPYRAEAPSTTQILLNLILSGHAREAQDLLSRAWPPGVAGRDIYWRDFTRVVARHRVWRRLDLGILLRSEALVAGQGSPQSPANPSPAAGSLSPAP
jgi:hypothetical protein